MRPWDVRKQRLYLHDSVKSVSVSLRKGRGGHQTSIGSQSLVLFLTAFLTDTLLNVFLAIAVDNLANAQELTKVCTVSIKYLYLQRTPSVTYVTSVVFNLVICKDILLMILAFSHCLSTSYFCLVKHRLTYLFWKVPYKKVYHYQLIILSSSGWRGGRGVLQPEIRQRQRRPDIWVRHS